MKPTIALVLTTDGVCNVACKTCPTGRRDADVDARRMSLEMFDRILDCAQSEAYVLSCCLYYFNEPFLHPHMPEMIRRLKQRGLYSLVSSNLSFLPSSAPMARVMEALDIGVSNLIVSVSGWTNETHQRSHKNSNIEWVKENMAKIAEHRKPETFLRLSWHVYDYNRDEMPNMRGFARRLGFRFTPYGTGVLPLERVLARWQDGMHDPVEADIMVKLPAAKKLCYERKHWNCQMQDQTVVVDYNGTVYLCGDRNSPANFRGSFFDKPLKQLLAERKTDPTCIACKAVGGHVYAAQEYCTPLHSPKRWADLVYRKLNLQRAFQTLSKKYWRRQVEGYYNRPGKL